MVVALYLAGSGVLLAVVAVLVWRVRRDQAAVSGKFRLVAERRRRVPRHGWAEPEPTVAPDVEGRAVGVAAPPWVSVRTSVFTTVPARHRAGRHTAGQVNGRRPS